MSKQASLTLFLPLLTACSADVRDTASLANADSINTADDGGAPSTGTNGGTMVPPTPGTGSGDGCSEAAKLVYVIDSNTELSSFRPDTGVFTTIGKIDCMTMGGGGLPLPLPIPGLSGNPFSMSVDRNGIAWVLYDTGELFRVDPKDASCTATARMPGEGGFDTFGMGYASNAANSSTDTLYIAGNGDGSFGVLDPATGTATRRGTLNGSPELTGTGAGELWGFFPDTTPPRIDLMDKTSGTAERTFNLSQLQGTPLAWAFAFWGGDFWLFLQKAADPSTVVYRVNGKTAELTTSIPNSGKRIVGAGVSTCAPLTVL